MIQGIGSGEGRKREQVGWEASRIRVSIHLPFLLIVGRMDSDFYVKNNKRIPELNVAISGCIEILKTRRFSGSLYLLERFTGSVENVRRLGRRLRSL